MDQEAIAVRGGQTSAASQGLQQTQSRDLDKMVSLNLDRTASEK